MNESAVSRGATASAASRQLVTLQALFVVVWGSAWIAGKYGLASTGPFTLLAMRMATASVVFLLITLIARAPWPSDRRQYLHLAVAGVLIQAATLGGVYGGMSLGVSPGISVLFTGLAPLLTALMAGPLLGETVTRRQWISLVIGLGGVALVVANKLAVGHADWHGYFWSTFALIAFVSGTLYQKKFCASMDLRTGNFIQVAAATVVILVPAIFVEHLHATPTRSLIAAVGWMGLINSVGGMTLLYVLLRRGSASSVASLFYMVPPVTVVMAWVFFREVPSTTTIIGGAIVALSVYFGTRSAEKRQSGLAQGRAKASPSNPLALSRPRQTVYGTGGPEAR